MGKYIVIIFSFFVAVWALGSDIHALYKLLIIAGEAYTVYEVTKVSKK